MKYQKGIFFIDKVESGFKITNSARDGLHRQASSSVAGGSVFVKIIIPLLLISILGSGIYQIYLNPDSDTIGGMILVMVFVVIPLFFVMINLFFPYFIIQIHGDKLRYQSKRASLLFWNLKKEVPYSNVEKIEVRSYADFKTGIWLYLYVHTKTGNSETICRFNTGYLPKDLISNIKARPKVKTDGGKEQLLKASHYADFLEVATLISEELNCELVDNAGLPRI